jgi:plasmid rolling circle replication initiator protein Rep
MTEELRSDENYLTNISEKDKSFDTHKAASGEMARLYGLDGNYGLKGFMHGSRVISFDSYESRINECGAWLKFYQSPNDFRLIDARFCKVPYCPMCQFRRSLKWRAKFLAVLPDIQKQFPTHKWIFLTLTVRNCHMDDLRSTIKQMGQGWQRLSQLVNFPLEGCIKSLEVTRIWDWYDHAGELLGRHGVKWWYQKLEAYKKSKTGSDPRTWVAKPTEEVHPHFHILGMVKASYFSTSYITQKEWSETWKKSMRLDYSPIVHIERVKDKTEPSELDSQDISLTKGMIKGICETLKYTVKEQDLLGSFCKDEDINSDWLKELTLQLYLLRRVEYKGVLKQFGKDVEKSMNNLVDIDEDKEEEVTKTGQEVIAYWNKYLKRYVVNIKADLETCNN